MNYYQLTCHFEVLKKLYNVDATRAAEYVFGIASGDPKPDKQQNSEIEVSTECVLDTMKKFSLSSPQPPPSIVEMQSESTLPFYQTFEKSVFGRVKEFYRGRHEVLKKTFVDKDGNALIPDITVMGYAVFDVKSGTIKTNELEKLEAYAKIANVTVKGLILSNMKILSPSHKKFCISHDIHVIFDDTLESGLEEIEKNKKSGSLIQEYPPNHVINVKIEGIPQEYLDRYLKSVQVMPNNISGDACIKLWPKREEIVTIYRESRAQGWSKSKCLALVKEECKIQNGESTIKRFIDLFFQNVAKYYQE